MEVGEGALRRASVNCLRESLTLRRDYELVWPGGKDLKSARVNFISERDTCSIQLRATETVLWSDSKSGSRVIQALWSAPITRDSTLEQLLAVLLDDRLTVLSLCGSNNKAVKRKEISGKFVPQGCSWHPTLPVFAFLSARQAAVSRFTQDVDHVILSISGRLVSCAWSPDGHKLAVCSSSHLYVYLWRDFGDLKNITCQKWGSLDSNVGAIRTTVAMSPSTFLLTTEPFMKNMWSVGSADVFDAGTNHGADNTDFIISDASLNSAELVVPRTCASEDNKDSLKFKLNNLSESTGSTKAQCVVVNAKDGKLEKLSSAVLDDFLSPDLLLFEPNSNAVVVGSNLCGELQVLSYSPATPVKSASLTKVRKIKLESNYRPKGLTSVCNMSGILLVLLALPKKDPHPAFPPSSNFEEYYLKLQCLSLHMPSAHRQEDQAPGGAFDVTKLQSPGELKSLRLPDGTVWQEAKESKNLIMEVEGTDDCSQDKFDKKALHAESKGQVRQVQHMRKIDEKLANFQTEVHKRLCVLEAKFDNLSESGSTKAKLLHQYPTLNESGYIHIKWCDGDEQKTETFLLDHGRLKLETVQKTFGKTLVQVYKDGYACIISAGEDGFIPIHFASGSTVCMTGKTSSPPSPLAPLPP